MLVQKHLPQLAYNSAFVGLTFCKRVYSVRDWATAVRNSGQNLVKTAQTRDSDSVGPRRFTAVIEAMVHPGFIGSGWDAFNASPERERELEAMMTSQADMLAMLHRKDADADAAGLQIRFEFATPLDVVKRHSVEKKGGLPR